MAKNINDKLKNIDGIKKTIEEEKAKYYSHCEKKTGIPRDIFERMANFPPPVLEESEKEEENTPPLDEEYEKELIKNLESSGRKKKKF